MAWNCSLYPLPYLKKRLIYYEKKKSQFDNRNKAVVNIKNGKISLRQPFQSASFKKISNSYRDKIREFEKAIKVLENNGFE